MFRSLSRITVAVALVLAFLLSTIPAQAQPLDPGASFTFDTSWFEAALGWLADLVGGDSDGLQVRTTSGPCLDPWGGCPAG